MKPDGDGEPGAVGGRASQTAVGGVDFFCGLGGPKRVGDDEVHLGGVLLDETEGWPGLQKLPKLCFLYCDYAVPRHQLGHEECRTSKGSKSFTVAIKCP